MWPGRNSDELSGTIFRPLRNRSGCDPRSSLRYYLFILLGVRLGKIYGAAAVFYEMQFALSWLVLVEQWGKPVKLEGKHKKIALSKDRSGASVSRSGPSFDNAILMSLYVV